MLKAVLFDLDQTLMDWTQVEPWEAYQLQRITALLDYARRELGAPPSLTADTLFTVFVETLAAAWQHSRATLQAPDIRVVLVQTLAAVGVAEDRLDPTALLEAYDWQPPAGERPYPDVLQVLPELRAHGLALGLITNASHPMTIRDHELRQTGLLDLFPTCRLSAADVGVIKPHPAIFARGLELLGVEPHQAVFVGDSLAADVAGAQRAGIPAVWIARQGEVTPDSAEVVPDASISTLHELLPVLDSWFPGWRSNGHSR